MNLTDKQRKMWIWIAVIVGLYVARSLFISAMQMQYYQQQAVRAAQQRANAKAAAAAPMKLAGIWRGRAVFDGLGQCDIRVELLEKTAGHLTGYSTFTCTPRGSPRPANPDSAILSGSVADGAVHFHIDKTIGTDTKDCAVTSFTVTPFGASQLAAEWEKGPCPGGHVILQRTKS
jgi:hypothetical protein